MKKLLIALSFAAFAALPAQADGNFGIKLGQLSGDGDTGAATQVGLVYTWDFVGLFGAEFELNTSAAKGEFGPIEYGVTQLGGYGVVMSPGPFYFKGKLGVTYSDTDLAGVDASADLAYGVGFGAELVGFVWELEWTRSKIDSIDVDFISVSMKF